MSKKKDVRSAQVFTLLKPVEAELLKRRAAEHGSTVSSTIRLLVLKDLFKQANIKMLATVPARDTADE